MVSKSPLTWDQSPSVLKIGADEIHLWRINLNPPLEWVDRLRDLLSDEEKKRSERFLKSEMRRRSIVTRACLRLLLGKYVRLNPRLIAYQTNPFGKPFLSYPSDIPLQFNLTHCKDLALVAIAMNRQVGIDLEVVRPVAQMERIVQNYLSPSDRQVLETCSPDQKLTSFFKAWTRLEAYGKAVGTGLASLAPVSTDRLENTPEWTLAEYEMEEQHVIAIVVEGSRCQVQSYDFRVEESPQLL